MKSNYEIDDETRKMLRKKEQWHFCMIQLGWFTIIVFMTSLFELLIFAIGFFGTDYVTNPNPVEFWAKLVSAFKFECANGTEATWYIDHSAASMTLFKLHFVVIFMYTALFSIVLYKIPYKYDRIKMSKSEKKSDRKRR